MRKNLVIYIAIIAITLSLASTSNAQLGNILNKAKDAIDKKKDKKKQDEPPTNQPTNSDSSTGNSNDTKPNKQTVQENPLGKILLSNKSFDGNNSDNKTTFQSNEFIYGRLLLKNGTVRDLLKDLFTDKDTPAAYVRLRINFKHEGGATNSDYYVPLNDAELDKTYWDFDILPSPDQAHTANIENIPITCVYSYLVGNYSKEGENKFSIGVSVPTKDFRGKQNYDDKWLKFESNDFILNLTGSDFQTIKANGEKLINDFAANTQRKQIANQVLPKQWTEKTNPLLPIATDAQLRSMYLNRFTDKTILKIIKLHASVPSSVSWSIQTNDIGIPSYRYSNQWYTVFVKNTSTHECFFDSFGLRQNYSGGGTYGQTFLDFNEGSQKFFVCDKMNAK